jgi:hypothetical protein
VLNVGGGQWRDTPCVDELGQCGFADSHVPADLHELDAAFSDQAADEARGRTQALGRCINRQ